MLKLVSLLMVLWLPGLALAQGTNVPVVWNLTVLTNLTLGSPSNPANTISNWAQVGPLAATNQLFNGTASVNGQPITNGATITVSSGGGATNLLTILSTGPQAGNGNGLVITNLGTLNAFSVGAMNLVATNATIGSILAPAGATAVLVTSPLSLSANQIHNVANGTVASDAATIGQLAGSTNSSGTITAGYFVGNGSGLTGIGGSSVASFATNSSYSTNSGSLGGVPAASYLTNQENRIFWADAYLTNDNSTDDSVGLTNLLSLSMTNSTVYWSGKTAFFKAPTNNLTWFNYSPNNVRWIGNGQTLRVTNRNNAAASGIFGISGITNFYIENMSFTGPTIATNGSAADDTALFTITGLNVEWVMKGTHWRGFHWGLVEEAPCFNYDFSVTYSTFNDMGNYQAADGGFSDLSGLRMEVSHNVFSNCFRAVEMYDTTGIQSDSGDWVLNDNAVIDVQDCAYKCIPNTIWKGMRINGLTVTAPSAGQNSIYNASIGVNAGNVSNLDIANIQISSTALYYGLYITPAYNLTIRNVQSTAQNDIIGANYSIKDSTLGNITININSTGNVQNVGSTTFVNNGVLTYSRDTAGNVTAGTNLTLSNTPTTPATIASTPITIAASYVSSGFGSATWNTTFISGGTFPVGVGVVNAWQKTTKRIIQFGGVSNQTFMFSGTSTTNGAYAFTTNGPAGQWWTNNAGVYGASPGLISGSNPTPLNIVGTPDYTTPTTNIIPPNFPNGVGFGSNGSYAFMSYVATNHFLRGYGTTTNSIYDNGTIQVEAPGLN
jgi:hypothetical protein